jgi:hypothetical protein
VIDEMDLTNVEKFDRMRLTEEVKERLKKEGEI